MISIITINYNNCAGLIRTLDSLAAQKSMLAFEHLIIDGGSTDGSVEYAHAFAKNHIWSSVVSESDTGIYNAMNKGIALSTRDYVGFLNSGDVLSNEFCLDKIHKVLDQNSQIDFMYSDLSIVDEDSKVIRQWSSGEFCRYKLYLGWMPPHPMTIVRKEILQFNDGFSEEFEISADYDLMLRILIKDQANIYYLPEFIVEMEAGGISNGSISSILKGNIEVLRSWFKIRGVTLPFWILFMKPISKIYQIRY